VHCWSAAKLSSAGSVAIRAHEILVCLRLECLVNDVTVESFICFIMDGMFTLFLRFLSPTLALILASIAPHLFIYMLRDDTLYNCGRQPRDYIKYSMQKEAGLTIAIFFARVVTEVTANLKGPFGVLQQHVSHLRARMNISI